MPQFQRSPLASKAPRSNLSFADLLSELATAHDRDLLELAEKLAPGGHGRSVSKLFAVRRHEKGIVSKIISKEPVKERRNASKMEDSNDLHEAQRSITAPEHTVFVPDSIAKETPPRTPSREPPSMLSEGTGVGTFSRTEPPLPNSIPEHLEVHAMKSDVVLASSITSDEDVADKLTHQYARGKDGQSVLVRQKLANKFCKPPTLTQRALAYTNKLSERCKEPPRSGRLADCLGSMKFQVASATVIFFNAITTSLLADIDMRSRGAERSGLLDMFEILFLCWYTLELALKLALHGMYFFWNDETAWGVFDLCLVIQAWIDVILTEVMDGAGANLAFARMARLLKLSKIFRIFRMVKLLRDLRTMLTSLVSSFMAMLWALVLLFTCLFMMALMFVQLQAGYLQTATLSGTADPVIVADIESKFGSVTTTMNSLFMATTGGVDWIELWQACPEDATKAALVVFIFFLHFSLLNVVTGIVMEKAVRNAQPDRDELIME
eukprot:TRINITY_DN41653_c0_g1_i1.p1 TRINITY_DN41653_c0_g1~~TRINITY_DN41653_c0_g1_i1.p1  ORF type:complete len:495 (+),score=101.81 TRINITY_DN41653_c0_g1_i1:30-1514(+)